MADDTQTVDAPDQTDSGGSLASLAQPPDTSSLPTNTRPDTAPSNLGQAVNPPSESQEPLKGLGGRLRGVLYGLALGGPVGGIAGAIAPNTERAVFQRRQDIANANRTEAQAKAQSAVQNVQFESVQAADTHINAMKQAQHYDAATAEARAQVRQLNDAHEKFLTDEYGILPDLSIEGNGQEVHDQATGALGTLAGENGGQIPPVSVNVQPHTDTQSKFKIGVYAPSQQDLTQNQQGYRQVVNDARAVQGLPQIDDLSWSTQGFKGQRQMAQGAMEFLAPSQSFNKDNIGAMLAQRQQMLANYQKHVDQNGQPDAKPAIVSQLQSSVDYLKKAKADILQENIDSQVKIEQALQPIKMAQIKAEEAVKDGDPKAAAQLLVSGDVAPSQIISARKPAFAQQAFTEAKQIDPNWNSQAAEGYFKTASAPANVQFFGSAKSLTDQGGTLDQLKAAYDKLPNGRIPAFNSVADWATAAAGGGSTAGFAQTALGVADDYAKVMGGGQGSDTSRKQVLDSFARSSSGPQMDAAILAARKAVDSQMKSRIGANPVMNRMYGQGLLVHVKDPQGGDHTFRTQEQADSFKKAAGIQ